MMENLRNFRLVNKMLTAGTAYTSVFTVVVLTSDINNNFAVISSLLALLFIMLILFSCITETKKWEDIFRELKRLTISECAIVRMLVDNPDPYTIHINVEGAIIASKLVDKGILRGCSTKELEKLRKRHDFTGLAIPDIKEVYFLSPFVETCRYLGVKVNV